MIATHQKRANSPKWCFFDQGIAQNALNSGLICPDPPGNMTSVQISESCVKGSAIVG